MPEIQLGCGNSHTVMSHGAKVAATHKHDWLILVLLAAIEAVMLLIEPFHRFIGEEMMTDLKYPFKPNTVPIWAVPIIAILVPIAIFIIYYISRKDVYDLHHAVLGILFSAALTGVMTDSIKNAVGRPRPNFFYRCFPDGIPAFSNVTHDVVCHGEAKIIKEGYKSFPSGHTSWSFCGLVFLAWYLSGKIKAFDRRGHIAKLCIVIFPILVAALIGVSRVDDYWHHWTDVFAGALLGTTIATFCYLQFFPWPHDAKGWAPHAYFDMMEEQHELRSSSSRRTGSSNGRRPDLDSPFLGLESGIEITSSRDTAAVLGAMEAGKRSI